MTTVVTAPSAQAVEGSGTRGFLQSLVRPDFIIGFGIVSFWILCALLPGLITPGDPTATFPDGVTLLGEPVPPGTPGFLLGSDPIGRDYFTRWV